MFGTIKNVRLDKGFAFIRGDDGLDYFLHKTAYKGSPFDHLTPEVSRVEFTPVASDKGPRAEAARPVVQ